MDIYNYQTTTTNGNFNYDSDAVAAGFEDFFLEDLVDLDFGSAFGFASESIFLSPVSSVDFGFFDFNLLSASTFFAH